MKKLRKDTGTYVGTSADLQNSNYEEYLNRSQSAQTSLKEALEAVFKGTPSTPYSEYAPPIDFKTAPSVTPCQYYSKIIVDGVDVVKMLTDIAVVTGALRDSTSIANLDVIQHYSAERLAQFIVNDSKKIISGSGDAVTELTAWLLSKAD